MTSGLEKLAKADDTTIVVVVKAEKDGKLRVTQSPPRVAARRKPRLGVAREDPLILSDQISDPGRASG
jgi:hypothetical protein